MEKVTCGCRVLCVLRVLGKYKRREQRMIEIKKGHVEAGGVRYGYEIHGTVKLTRISGALQAFRGGFRDAEDTTAVFP